MNNDQIIAAIFELKEIVQASNRQLNGRISAIENRMAELSGSVAVVLNRTAEERENRANQTAKLMNIHLDMNEVRDLCFDLQVDFDNVLGQRKIDKIKALVGLFYRQNLLDVLINWLHGIRPDVDWPENHISAVD